MQKVAGDPARTEEAAVADASLACCELDDARRWLTDARRGPNAAPGRRGQEDQLGALGLVLNAAVLWTTRYLDAAVEQLRTLPAERREYEVLDEDVTRLSPLKHANLNVLGRYSFRASGPAGGALRPLRDPKESDDDDEAED